MNSCSTINLLILKPTHLPCIPQKEPTTTTSQDSATTKSKTSLGFQISTKEFQPEEIL
jgi:hypothetical protein